MTSGPPRSGDRLPRPLLAMVSVCILGLLAGIVLSYAYARTVNHRLAVLEQYVQGRGEFRDRENARTNQRIDDAICDLLDQLPEGGLLERPRKKYGCGPGLPLASLPSSVQQQLHRRPAQSAAPTAPRDAPPAPSPPPTMPTSGAATPAPSSSPATAKPSPSAPRRPRPLTPLTDRLCDVAGVCP